MVVRVPAMLRILAACLSVVAVPALGADSFLVGGDISALPVIEKAGGVFRDQGQRL